MYIFLQNDFVTDPYLYDCMKYMLGKSLLFYVYLPIIETILTVLCKCFTDNKNGKLDIV